MNTHTIFYYTQDWQDFTTIEGLCRKSGTTRRMLIALAAKELLDNALDECEAEGVKAGYIEETANKFFIQDQGRGFSHSDSELANLFSIKREMISSKRIRKPSRGALGNGLRVVSGVVATFGGYIVIETGGRVLRLNPDKLGSCDFERLREKDTTGTRIEIHLPNTFNYDGFEKPLFYVERSLYLSKQIDKKYTGKTSAHWYDFKSFSFLLQTAEKETTTRQFLEEFDGVTGARLGQIAKSYPDLLADFEEEETLKLFNEIISKTKAVSAARLGYTGSIHDATKYIKQTGNIHLDTEHKFSLKLTKSGSKFESKNTIPYVIEIFVLDAISAAHFESVVFVNHSPISSNVYVNKSTGNELVLFAGGRNISSTKKLSRNTSLPPIWLNIITPFMPIVSDGKQPDFAQMTYAIQKGLDKAVSFIKSSTKQKGKRIHSDSLKAFISANIDNQVRAVSSDHKYRYSLRQLYYQFRPILAKAGYRIEGDSKYNYFCKIIAEIENERGHDLRGIWRNDRGKMISPHSEETTYLGTQSVEQYQFPDYEYNKVLFVEKEGFFSILQDAEFGKKYDCAIMSSSGYSNKATRDLIDKIYERNPDTLFFCLHDCDSAGTMIYQTLQEATTARAARKAKIIDLGLTPDQAEELGLEVEQIKKQSVIASTKYQKKYGNWFENQRVELNAMTSEQFILFLESELKKYDEVGKVIPELDYLNDTFEASLKEAIKNQIEEEVLREQREAIEERLKERLELANKDFPEDIYLTVSDGLTLNPSQSWRNVLEAKKEEIVLKFDNNGS